MAKGNQFSLADLSDRLRAIHSMASMTVSALTNDDPEGGTAEVLQKYVCDALESEIGKIKRHSKAAYHGSKKAKTTAKAAKNRSGLHA